MRKSAFDFTPLPLQPLLSLVLCIGVAGSLSGCVSAPPTADELLRRFAENRGKGEFALQADTPEDAAEMNRAADELRARLVPPPPVVKTGNADGVMEVAVTAPHGMAGNWHMVSPTQLHIRSGAPDSWGTVSHFLCRIEQDGEKLSGSCLPQRHSIHGTLRGDELHFGWSSGLVRADIDGRLLSPTDFIGEVSVGTLGVDLIETDAPAYGNKIATLPPSPEGADAEAAVRFAEISGKRSYSYLGSVELPADPEAKREAGPMLVYDVEFEKSWQLCGFMRGAVEVECR